MVVRKAACWSAPTLMFDLLGSAVEMEVGLGGKGNFVAEGTLSLDDGKSPGEMGDEGAIEASSLDVPSREGCVVQTF